MGGGRGGRGFFRGGKRRPKTKVKKTEAFALLKGTNIKRYCRNEESSSHSAAKHAVAQNNEGWRRHPERVARFGTLPDLWKVLCRAVALYFSGNFVPRLWMCLTERHRTFVMQIRSKVGLSAASPRIRFHSQRK